MDIRFLAITQSLKFVNFVEILHGASGVYDISISHQ